MPNHDPADTVHSAPATIAIVEDGGTKTLKAVRKRSRRTLAVEELPGPAISIDEPGSPVGDPKSSGRNSHAGLETLVPTVAEADSLTGLVGMKPVDRHLPEPGFPGLTSAIPPDERAFEAILNGLMPVEYARLRVFKQPVRSRHLPELERSTRALRAKEGFLPATASSSSWVKSQPTVSPPTDPFIVGPNRRMAWRRTP
ncbi:MAG: hypothetical protein ACRYGI_09680 [Janthinobacterium lividum]